MLKKLNGNYLEVAQALPYESGGPMLAPQVADADPHAQILMDIHRSTFLAIDKGQLPIIWLTTKLAVFTQGDIDGRIVTRNWFQFEHAIHYHQQHPEIPGLREGEHISNEVAPINAANQKTLYFGYLDDQGQPCAFVLTYDKTEPEFWKIAIIRNANAFALTERQVTVFYNNILGNRDATGGSGSITAVPTQCEQMLKELPGAIGSEMVSSLLQTIIVTNKKGAAVVNLDLANHYATLLNDAGEYTPYDTDLLEKLLPPHREQCERVIIKAKLGQYQQHLQKVINFCGQPEISIPRDEAQAQLDLVKQDIVVITNLQVGASWRAHNFVSLAVEPSADKLKIVGTGFDAKIAEQKLFEWQVVRQEIKKQLTAYQTYLEGIAKNRLDTLKPEELPEGVCRVETDGTRVYDFKRLSTYAYQSILRNATNDGDVAENFAFYLALRKLESTYRLLEDCTPKHDNDADFMQHFFERVSDRAESDDRVLNWQLESPSKVAGIENKPLLEALNWLHDLKIAIPKPDSDPELRKRYFKMVSGSTQNTNISQILGEYRELLQEIVIYYPANPQIPIPQNSGGNILAQAQTQLALVDQDILLLKNRQVWKDCQLQSLAGNKILTYEEASNLINEQHERMFFATARTVATKLREYRQHLQKIIAYYTAHPQLLIPELPDQANILSRTQATLAKVSADIENIEKLEVKQLYYNITSLFDIKRNYKTSLFSNMCDAVDSKIGEQQKVIWFAEKNLIKNQLMQYAQHLQKVMSYYMTNPETPIPGIPSNQEVFKQAKGQLALVQADLALVIVGKDPKDSWAIHDFSSFSREREVDAFSNITSGINAQINALKITEWNIAKLKIVPQLTEYQTYLKGVISARLDKLPYHNLAPDVYKLGEDRERIYDTAAIAKHYYTKDSILQIDTDPSDVQKNPAFYVAVRKLAVVSQLLSDCAKEKSADFTQHFYHEPLLAGERQPGQQILSQARDSGWVRAGQILIEVLSWLMSPIGGPLIYRAITGHLPTQFVQKSRGEAASKEVAKTAATLLDLRAGP